MSEYLNDITELVKEVEVKTFVERLYCKQCGSEMKYSGMCLTSNPPWYPHSCSNCECNWSVCVRHSYPRTFMRQMDSNHVE